MVSLELRMILQLKRTTISLANNNMTIVAVGLPAADLMKGMVTINDNGYVKSDYRLFYQRHISRNNYLLFGLRTSCNLEMDIRCC